MLKKLFLLFYVFSKEEKHGSYNILKNNSFTKSEILKQNGSQLISIKNSMFYVYRVINTGVFFDSVERSTIVKLEFNENDDLIKTTKIEEKEYNHLKKSCKKPNIKERTFLESMFGSIGSINLEKSFK